MTKRELARCPNFTGSEVSRAGGTLSRIHYDSFILLQIFRSRIKRRIKFQYNGITGGKHSAPEHPKGKAFDIRFNSKDGKVTWIKIKRYIILALRIGFTEIGIYYNGVEYSMHLGCGNRYAFWMAYKRKGKRKWEAYRNLFNNPQYFI